MAGLFFCLASVKGAGLLFCPAAIQPHTSVYSTFCAVHAELYRPHHKTAHRALETIFLQFVSFCRRRYQTGTSGYNTACDTLEHITAPLHLQHIPDTTVTPDAGQGSTSQTIPARRGGQLLPYAERWQVLTRCQQYRPGAPAEWAAPPPAQGQPGGVSMLPTPGGLQSGTLHPAGQSSSRGTAGGAEPLTATAVSFFGLSPDS